LKLPKHTAREQVQTDRNTYPYVTGCQQIPNSNPAQAIENPSNRPYNANRNAGGGDAIKRAG
jgi:hypothetical protein